MNIYKLLFVFNFDMHLFVSTNHSVNFNAIINRHVQFKSPGILHCYLHFANPILLSSLN